jgi:hypothetical protein
MQEAYSKIGWTYVVNALVSAAGSFRDEVFVNKIDFGMSCHCSFTNNVHWEFQTCIYMHTKIYICINAMHSVFVYVLYAQARLLLLWWPINITACFCKIQTFVNHAITRRFYLGSIVWGLQSPKLTTVYSFESSAYNLQAQLEGKTLITWLM